MEGKRSTPASTSSSSSLVSELFGEKDLSGKPPPSSWIFGSIFPPASTIAGADSSRSNNSKKPTSSGGISKSKASSNHLSQLSSSVFYGGQDFYSHPILDSKNSAPSYNRHCQYKEEGENTSDPIDSRGDWWQGSLYY